MVKKFIDIYTQSGALLFLVELKVRDGGVVSPARQLLSTLWQALFTMSLYCVKVSLKLRADAALTPIYAITPIAAKVKHRSPLL